MTKKIFRSNGNEMILKGVYSFWKVVRKALERNACPIITADSSLWKFKSIIVGQMATWYSYVWKKKHKCIILYSVMDFLKVTKNFTICITWTTNELGYYFLVYIGRNASFLTDKKSSEIYRALTVNPDK